MKSTDIDARSKKLSQKSNSKLLTPEAEEVAEEEDVEAVTAAVMEEDMDQAQGDMTADTEAAQGDTEEDTEAVLEDMEVVMATREDTEVDMVPAQVLKAVDTTKVATVTVTVQVALGGTEDRKVTEATVTALGPAWGELEASVPIMKADTAVAPRGVVGSRLAADPDLTAAEGVVEVVDTGANRCQPEKIGHISSPDILRSRPEITI